MLDLKPLNLIILLGNPAISAAVGANSNPIIVTIAPIEAGGNNFLIHPVPTKPTMIAMVANNNPDTTNPLCTSVKEYPSPIKSNTGDINAKLDPKYAGIFLFVMKAYNKVPIPLKNKTVAGSIFKRIGTKTDDPNIANKCWTLKGIAFFRGNLSSTPMTSSSSTSLFCTDSAILLSSLF